MNHEHPRPQLVRPAWTNLNGPWSLGFDSGAVTDEIPSSISFDRVITVPFPIEAKLSGIGERVPDDHAVWYRRSFQAPTGDRVLLHFGAVDWSATVWVNGKKVGSHEGGYDPFSFDITEALVEGEQIVVVAVTDPTDAGPQPRGKQVRTPEGIWYTPVTGIWQTVWLEAVPTIAVESIRLHPKNDGTLRIELKHSRSEENVRTFITVMDGDETVTSASGTSQVLLQVENPRLWSPEDPHLYRLIIQLANDEVESYVGFREVGLVKDDLGRTRIGLNGKPVFMLGPLDQGYWPDGLLTAPSDEALRYDIEITQRMGFNMIRKHVKVEPARWYGMCDKMGMLVWQDMPSGDAGIAPEDPDLTRTPESAAIYERELRAMIGSLFNHPSIVCWIPFNEGWGQFDTARITQLVRDLDPSRLIDATTGWSDRGVGDMIDWHIYPGPGSPNPEDHRAAVLGEFGGLGYVVPGHDYGTGGWGYQSFQAPEELATRYEELFEQLRELVAEPGLSAAVYTQTSDVETETNGLMTYDRSILKIDLDQIKKAVRSVIEA